MWINWAVVEETLQFITIVVLYVLYFLFVMILYEMHYCFKTKMSWWFSSSEIESDHCMSELLEPVRGMMCSMTEGCQELMTRAGFDKYALTHQILYTVVAEMVCH